MEAERRSHQTTKTSSTARERELEGRLTGTAEALADMQRELEEAGRRGRGVGGDQAMGGSHEAAAALVLEMDCLQLFV